MVKSACSYGFSDGSEAVFRDPEAKGCVASGPSKKLLAWSMHVPCLAGLMANGVDGLET